MLLGRLQLMKAVYQIMMSVPKTSLHQPGKVFGISFFSGFLGKVCSSRAFFITFVFDFVLAHKHPNSACICLGGIDLVCMQILGPFWWTGKGGCKKETVRNY